MARAALTTIAACGLLAAMPAAASAWTAQVVNGNELQADGTSSAEFFEVQEVGSVFRILEGFGLSAPVAGSGCFVSGANTVDCAKATINRIDVDGAGVSDIIWTSDYLPNQEFTGVELAFHGGAGGDNLNGAPFTGQLPVGVTLDGGSGDDHLFGASQEDILDGGPGNDPFLSGRGGDDVLRGDDGNDFLAGDSSEDVLRGGEGDDSLVGGTSDDLLRGGEGTDTFDAGNDPDGDLMIGGPGIDLATYSARSGGVSVDIGVGGANDGSAVDGPVGRRDEVDATVENLLGSLGNDVLTGNELDNSFRGLSGADVFNGLAGIDTVSYIERGSPGVVVVIDATANDGDSSDGPSGARDFVKTDVENLIGGSGPDTLKGGAAANLIIGGFGADSLFGLGGVDVLNADDGVADAVINCGNGTGETAIVDPFDPPPVSC